MKKSIIILLLCSFCFAEEQKFCGYNPMVIDKRQSSYKQDGKIFGDTSGDTTYALEQVRDKVYDDCGSMAPCDQYFNSNMNVMTNKTRDNLNDLLNSWSDTNNALDKIIYIEKHLPIAQINALSIEQDKVLKLKEIEFNLRQAVELNTAQIEILQSKKALHNSISK